MGLDNSTHSSKGPAVDDAAGGRPFRAGPHLAASRPRPIPVAGYPGPHAGDSRIAVAWRGAVDRGGIRLLDDLRRTGSAIRRRARTLSQARVDFLHGLRNRP